MIHLKSPAEIEKMRQSNRLVARVIQAMQERVAPGVTTLELDRWGRHVQENLKAKRQSGASLQKALDLKVQQVLGALEQANETSTSTDHPPGGDAAEEPAPGGAVPAEDDNAGDG